ncbi:MAG: sodium:calcium antiporter [Asgard group archaeon]
MVKTGLLFLLGETLFLLAVISFAADFLSKSVEVLEKKYGPSFVGSVILGFVTTLPELIFVIAAVLALENDIALGSAIGGNILLFTIGYGLVILLAHVYHKQLITLPHTLRDDLWYLLIASFFILLAAADGEFQLWEGLVLFLIYAIFVIDQFYESRQEMAANVEEGESITSREKKVSLAFLVAGSVILLIAIHPFVEAIDELSEEIGISALFLALVISPFASEMPEKISAIILTKKSMEGAEIAIANFIGSKVQNNSLLFGVMILIACTMGEPFEVGDAAINLLLMVATTVVGVKITFDLELCPKEGVLAVLLYVLVVITLFRVS